MIGLRTLLPQLEQLWYVPVRLSPRGATWTASYWRCRRVLLRHGPVHWYAAEHDGRPISIATVGRERAASLGEDLLGQIEATRQDGTRALTHPTHLADIDADVVIADIHPHFMNAFRNAGWLVVPSWIRWCGDIAVIPPRGSRSLKSDLKKVQAQCYTLELAGTPGDWDEFYTGMAVPYATQRFGDFAWVPSGAFLRVLRRWGTLHFIRRDGRRVAGFTALTSGDRAWFPLLGTLADPALRGDGVLAAVYAFTFEWARSRGLASADLGRSSPFLSDGVGRYKEKWGLRPVVDPMSSLLAVRPGAVVRDIFAREPVYIMTEDGLGVYRGEIQ